MTPSVKRPMPTLSLHHASLLWRSIRHTDPGRLYHRLRLEVQRRILARAPRLRPAAGLTMAARPNLPRPLLPPRLEAGGQGPQGAEARFLSQRWSLSPPLSWRPEARQLEVMNLHYMEYLEALTDDQVRDLIQDWIERNPPYAPGYWRDHWNSYALSIRCVVWMQQVAARNLSLENGWGETLRASLTQQLSFLMGNLELDIRGNHLIKNLKALLWGGAFFEGPQALAWIDRASGLLARELDEQILTDGCHFERSPAYHLQVFADLLECYSVLPAGSLKDRLRTALDCMAQAAADLAHPDGFPSLFNDGGCRMAYLPSETLAAFRALTGEAPEPRPAFAFPEAGYFGLRTGGDLLIVDCGPVAPDALPAHGHGDILAFEWTLGGHRFIVDTGVFEYVEGQARTRSRATRAHNTLTLDGQDQCEFWSSFRVGRRDRGRLDGLSLEAGRLDLRGHHNGYRHLAGGPIHHRRIQASPAGLEVTDEVRGGQSQRAEARLLLHPAVRVEEHGAAWWLHLPGRSVRLETTHPVSVEAAPWYPDFGVCEETRQLTLTYGVAPCIGSFCLRLECPPHTSTGMDGQVN